MVVCVFAVFRAMFLVIFICTFGGTFLCWCADGSQGNQVCIVDGKLFGICSCEGSILQDIVVLNLEDADDIGEIEDMFEEIFVEDIVFMFDEGMGSCNGNCLGKQCGDDGCGQSCGICEVGFFCSQGKCGSEMCVLDCMGCVCGSDGCDGICGFCDVGEVCSNGLCIVDFGLIGWDEEVLVYVIFLFLDYILDGLSSGIQMGYLLFISFDEVVLIIVCVVIFEFFVLQLFCNIFF